MNEPLRLTSANHSIGAETPRPLRRRRIVWLGVAGWTLLAGVAVWWLLRGESGPSLWIVRDADSLQPAVAEKFQGFFKTDLGFQRFYPWVLFGPYVALVAFCFPLERGRLRLGLAANLAACALFVLASRALCSRTSANGTNVVIVSTQRRDDSSGVRETSKVQVERLRIYPEKPLREQLPRTLGREESADRMLSDTVIADRPDLSDAGLSNLLGRLPQELRPRLTSPHPPPLRLLSTLLDLLAFGAIVSLAHSVHFYRRFREREHRALCLESNLANARLDALRAQLQPHFLFNSLNAIATLLRRDPRLAEATLMSLSELLRLALSQSDRPEVALREEMKFVDRYLEIQRTRFGDKLRIEQEFEPATLDCLVPTLLLQPLAENAIRHGIEPAEKAGLVRLTARRQDGRLVLTVEDDGVGLSRSAAAPLVPGAGAAPGSRGAGIGLTNLRTRLETLFGAEQKLELTARPDGGVRVRIEIPWRPAPPPANSGGAPPS